MQPSAPPVFSRRLLYLVTLISDFSLALVIFSVSRQLAEQGAGLAVLGWVGGGYSLAWAISGVTCGRWSDRWNRRSVMLIGTGLHLLSVVGLVTLHDHFGWYIAAYWLGGVAGGAIYPPLIAWLTRGNEEAGRHQRVQATRTLMRFCLAWNLGLICGQYGGGMLYALAPIWALASSGVFGLVNLGLVARLKEIAPPALVRDPAFATQGALDQKLSAAFAHVGWVANLGHAFCVALVMHLFPDLAVRLGVAPEHHGLMLAIMRGVIIATYFLMHRLAFWHRRFSVALVAQAIAIIGLLVLSQAQTKLGLTLGLCALGLLLGFNYFASLYYSTTGHAEKQKGLVTGIHEATLGLGMAVGCVVGGYTGVVLGPRAPYLLGAAVIVCAAVAQIIVYRWKVLPLTTAANQVNQPPPPES